MLTVIVNLLRIIIKMICYTITLWFPCLDGLIKGEVRGMTEK